MGLCMGGGGGGGGCHICSLSTKGVSIFHPNKVYCRWIVINYERSAIKVLVL